MKLSNKILVGFFSLGFIYLTAVFAEVRFRGTPNIINDSNSIGETVDITGVAYLDLQDLDKNINVVGSDQPRLEVRSLSGDLLRKLKYRISGDTLMLWNLRSEDAKIARITVFVSKTTFKGISVNAAVANVSGLQQELLNITQRAGHVQMSGNQIGKIQVEAFGRAHLNISDTNLDVLTARLESSEVVISSPLKLLKGSMTNNSFLRAGAIDEIQFKKDESSRLNVYQ